MDNENKVTPEELAADQAALQVAKEDEIRKTVIETYGFDETADEERIGKAVARELDHSKKLSGAIGQKIKYRDAAKNIKPIEKIETKPETDLSSIDLYALMDAKISQEDIEEVRKASKLLGKSIPETLRDGTFKTILARRVEERNIADATNTGSARRTTNRPTDSALIDNLRKGEVPEKGSADAEQLFWAKRGGKR